MTADGSYPVRNSAVGPGGEESFGYQQVMQMMHGLDPGQVGNAADLLTGLAEQLDSLRGALKSAAAQASQNWSGTAAQSAMNQFQVLHDQTAQLAAQSRTAGNTLNWLGNDVMPKYQSLPSPQVAGGWEGLVADAAQGVVSGKGGIEEAMAGGPGKAKADSAAQDYLKTFNQHLATANNAMPKSLASSATPGRQSTAWGTAPGGHAGSSAVAGTGPSSGYNKASGSGAPSGGAPASYAAPSTANPFTASKLPHSATASNASLQGYTPPAGTGTSPYGPGALRPKVTSGGGANPFARMPVVPGASRYGAGAAEGESGLGSESAKVGETGMPGETGTLPGENGATGGTADGATGAADAAGAETAGSEAAGAAGSGEDAAAMPMGAGGGGSDQGRERQRQAWMNEDQSIWALPDEDIGPVLE